MPGGAAIQFAGLENADDVLDWQSAQIPCIILDELTHFLASQFWYLLSRNRSPNGYRCRVRAGTNPDICWVRELIAPWVDNAFPNPAESGELRWFIRRQDKIIWLPAKPIREICTLGDDGGKCYREGCENCFPPEMSITFIRSSVYNNPDLLKADPGYISRLLSLDDVQKRRLHDGDWDAMPANLLIDAFNPQKHVLSGTAQDRINDLEWLRYVGADFGLHNAAEVFVGKEKKSGRLIVFAEDWPGHSRTFEQWGNDVKRLAGGPITDGAGGNRTNEHGWRQSIRKEGVPMCEPNGAHADPKLQYQCVNDAFKADELFVLEGCTKLIDMLVRLQRKIDPKAGVVTDDFDDKNFHLPAALRSIITLLRPPKHRSTIEFY